MSTVPTLASVNLAPQLIRHAQLKPWNNPRTHFDEARIEDLRSSMRERGFDPAFPLIVRPKYPVERYRIRHEEEFPHCWWVEFNPGGDLWNTIKTCRSEEEAADELVAAQMFEIAAGERRWRSAGAESIEFIPCSIRTLTDQQMLDIALIENLQHESMTAIEEAQGYMMLLALRDEQGQPLDTFATISKRIGRTEKHIRDRVSLCRLIGTKTGEALEREQITPTHARLLAKVPSASLRDELLQKVLKPSYGPGPMSSRDLEQKIKLEYQIELRGAKFDQGDANLVAEVKDGTTGERLSGGACGDCPFNTKNHENEKGSRLFMCTNPECFRAKEDASYEKWRTEATDTSRNRTALPAAENARLWNEKGNELAYNSPYVELDGTPEGDDLKRGVEGAPKWKKILKGTNVPVIVGLDSNGKSRELVERKLVIEAAREAEKGKPASERLFKQAKTEETETPSTNDDSFPGIARETAEEARARKEAADRELASRIEKAQFCAVVTGAGKLKLSEDFCDLALAALIECCSEHGDMPDVCERNGFKDEKGIWDAERALKKALKLAPAFKVALVVELVLMMHLDPARVNALPKWAKLLGIDLKGVRKTIETQFAAEQKAAEEQKQVSEGVAWKTRRENADDFKWNSSGVSDNPDHADIHFPKATKVNASVNLARDAKGWHVGWFVNHPKWGTSDPCSRLSIAYANRELALKSGLLAIQQQMKANKAPEEALKRVAEYIDLISLPKAAKKGAAK